MANHENASRVERPKKPYYVEANFKRIDNPDGSSVYVPKNGIAKLGNPPYTVHVADLGMLTDREVDQIGTLVYRGRRFVRAPERDWDDG